MHPDLAISRSKILLDVQFGHLDRDAAQALADAQGIGSLLPRPDLASPLYDPLQEPRWTLMMAVTWVGFRRIDLVQKYWNLVRAATGRWVRSASGYVVATEEPVWLHAVKTTLHDDEFADGGPVPNSFPKGWQLLRQRLAAGYVRGYGRDLTAGLEADVRLIPKENWNSLMICAAGGQDALRMMSSEAVRYIGIEFDQKDLMSIFHPVPVADAISEGSCGLPSREVGGSVSGEEPLGASAEIEESGLTSLMKDISKGVSDLWPNPADIPSRRIDRLEQLGKWFKARNQTAPSNDTFDRFFKRDPRFRS